MADNNKRFHTSNQSRRKTRRKSHGGLWLLLLIPLILALGIALGLTVRYILDQHEDAKKKETQQPSQTAGELPGIVESEEMNSTEETTPAESSSEEATAESTNDQQTEPTKPTQTTQPSQQEGAFTPTKAASELLPVPDTVGRETLSEGGWYGGKFVRDLSTGTVKCEWDRAADLIKMLKDYGAIYHKNEDQKVCYLTFDCGGTTSASDVNEILDTLKAKNVKAIFMIPGDYIMNNLNREGESIKQDCAASLRRIVEEGHLLGSHTYTHPQMPTLSDEDFIFQLNTQQNRIDKALGYAYPLSYYRPPEGGISERDLYLAQKMGYHVTLWSYEYMDWNPNNQMAVNEALNKAKVGLHDGCVYLFHALSSTNRAMLGDLIDYMRAEGYEVRRIDQ